jgi:hypothetical protein
MGQKIIPALVSFDALSGIKLIWRWAKQYSKISFVGFYLNEYSAIFAENRISRQFY